MSQSQKPPVFLERASYRQRRLRDAARLVPVLGIVLWLIPLLWSGDKADHTGRANAMIYVFVVWILLIALAAMISYLLRYGDDQNPPRGDAD